MRYFVIWPDGQRFGPADIATLRLWVAEQRIGVATLLEEEGTGRQVLASSLPDLGLVPSPYGPSGPSSPYGGSAPPAGPTSPYVPTSSGAYPPTYGPGPYQNPGGYYRPSVPTSSGSGETIAAWILGGTGLICCPLVSGIGIILAVMGQKKGQPGATAALYFCIATMLLALCLGAATRFAAMGLG